MNSHAISFLLLNAAVLLVIPRRWGPLPLLVGACYMTLGQGIEAGPFSLTVLRLLLGAGLIRVLVKGERLAGGVNSLDWLMSGWAVWILLTSFVRADPLQSFIFRLGVVYNTCGIYFLIRVFCQSMADVMVLIRITAMILVPLAVAMFYERMTGDNPFSFLGGVPETPWRRAGGFRAQGPFAHAILAGTVGAGSLPLMVALWGDYRKLAIAGIAACLTMIITSGSSGPVFSLAAAIGALSLYRMRHRLRVIRWLAVCGYILLELAMKAPAYYLIARTGTGGAAWHRARLIEVAWDHLQEWWLAGTDYTRHWMPYGITWSPDHTDITNYYIKMGVIGGLPLMLLFIFILAKSFSYLGQVLKSEEANNSGHLFIQWTIGASLFTHAVTMFAVAYFDQSFIFPYLNLALIGSIWSVAPKAHPAVLPEANLRFSVQLVQSQMQSK